LADSQAGLAEDLRREIREQIKAGKSDQEIIAFLTQRYGQFILYRPQVTPTTYLLWFGPFVLLIGGLFVLFRYIRHHRDSVRDEPLTSEDRRRAAELLASDSRKETA
jgi:cytochrome c-type biogenesis protein CcmH